MANALSIQEIFLQAFNARKDKPPPTVRMSFSPPEGPAIYGGIAGIVSGRTPEELANSLGEQAGATLAALRAHVEEAGGDLVYEEPNLTQSGKSLHWSLLTERHTIGHAGEAH